MPHYNTVNSLMEKLKFETNSVLSLNKSAKGIFLPFVHIACFPVLKDSDNIIYYTFVFCSYL